MGAISLAKETNVDYGKVIEFKTGVPSEKTPVLRFSDFSLQFIREEQIKGVGPTKFTYQIFELTDHHTMKKELSAASESGSLTPTSFEVDGKKFLLHVSYFKDAPDKGWLKNNQLVVTENKH